MTVFRVMIKVDWGQPCPGTGDCMLGVRHGIDVHPDREQFVHPLKGGMSVSPNSPANLPLHLRPEPFGGAGKLPLFAIDEGHFNGNLAYRADPKKPGKHGLVEPSAAMKLELFQVSLAETAPAWSEVPV